MYVSECDMSTGPVFVQRHKHEQIHLMLGRQVQW